MFLDCNTSGDNRLIGPNVQFLTPVHPLSARERLPGVTIGDNTTIAAGSIVTHAIPANVLAMGQPCKVVRELP